MTHEGTCVFKTSKFQLLTTQNENIKNVENKTFTKFYTKLSDIVNSRWGLGDRLLEGNICAKILRSLLELFKPKVTVIQEVRAIDTTNADELVGSLQTYELQFTNPKKTSIALKTSNSKYKNQEETNSESKIQQEINSESEDEEGMVSLAKKLYKYFKSKRGSM